MKLKAYKTTSPRRALRAVLESDYLDDRTLEKYRTYLDCSTIADDMYISLYITLGYPSINIDEYFSYVDLMGIDISRLSTERQDSFAVLIEILETKYGIEYVDSDAES